MAHVGQDQYLPDDIDETLGFTQNGDENQMNGHTQYKETQGGGNGVIMQESSELNETQKLQLAERANEIYRQQLKYMQDHLASLRSLIQDKENIIENLMLRYDLGIITQDQNRQTGNLGPDEIEMEELRRKAEALAQRTILENFELREMVNELRDENFHLRNEIYELQDKINRQVLQINKLEKAAQQNANVANFNTGQNTDMATTMDQDMNPYGMDDDPDDNDIYGDVEEDEDQYIEDAPTNTRAHDRGASITGADWMNNGATDRATGRRESRSMDHPANSEEARGKRIARSKNHERKESVKPPDIFGDDQSDEEDYMDDDARAKRQERADKTRKESIATPDIYGDAQGESEEDGDDEDEEDNRPPQQAGTKRRGSQIYMNEEALAKRQQRSNHRRGSSVATPNIFNDNYDPEKVARDKAKKYAPEAIQKRLQRKAKRVGAAAVKHVKSHRRKESLAEKLLLGPMDDEDDVDLKAADPEQRKELQAKARKEQRRKSRQLIKSQVGAKEHFSDDDVELQEDKPQRAGLKSRKKSSQRTSKQQAPEEEMEIPQYNQANKKRGSIKADPMITTMGDDEKDKKHRRDSSSPIVNLGFEDPDVLIHYEKLKVQDLEKELENKLNELDEVRKERDAIKSQIETQVTNANEAVETSQTLSRELDEAVQSKADLAQKCAMEIMRLSMILNTLQQMPKIRDLVTLLIDESSKDNKTNKNSSLLG